MNLEKNKLDVSNRYSTRLTNIFPDQQNIENAIKEVSEKPVGKKEEELKKSDKKPEEISLEKTVEQTPENEIEDLREQYGLFEDLNLAGVDYESLFSYLEHHQNLEEIYGKQEEDQKENSLLFESGEEIEETVQKVMVNYMLGNKDGVSYEEKEKLRNLADFDKSRLMFYHQLSPIKSDNVDYSRLN